MYTYVCFCLNHLAVHIQIRAKCHSFPFLFPETQFFFFFSEKHLISVVCFLIVEASGDGGRTQFLIPGNGNV